MAKRRQLSSKQLAVIDDLFRGELDEQAILEKYRVKKGVYNKWLTDELFAGRFNQYLEALKRQGELIIARCTSLAATKLAELTESENQETARKACLDIIKLPKPAAGKSQQSGKDQKGGEKRMEHLSPEVADRLLTALADIEDSGVK